MDERAKAVAVAELIAEASRAMGAAVTLCVDCVTVGANGPDAEGVDPDWPGFLPEWSEWIMAPMLQAGGEPEDPFFSGYPCEGCGSYLAGDRFYYIAVPR